MTSTTEPGTATDLQGWIDRLSQAAREGELLELADSGSADLANAQSWGPNRCIPAAALRHVLTTSGLTVDPRGLRISGARFCGELDLAHIAFPHPLHLINCTLGEVADLHGAALKELSLADSHTRHVKLEGAQIADDLLADGLEADGGIDATRVQVGGQLNLCEAKLNNADGEALNLDTAKVTGGVFANSLKTHGSVSAMVAQIGVQLNLSKAKLDKMDGDALILDGTVVTGGMSAKGLEAHGSVRAMGLQLGGPLDLREAKLDNADGHALILDSAKVIGGMFAEGLETYGEIRAMVAQIGVQLDFSNAKLHKADGDALSLDGTTVTGGMSAKGLEAHGSVRAVGLRLGGPLVLREAKLNKSDGEALNLDGARLPDSMFAEGLEAHGGVHAVDAKISGQLDLSKAKLHRTDSDALSPHNAADVIAGGYALSLRGATVPADVFAHGLEALGEFRAPGCSFGGALDLSEAKLRNCDGKALNLESASIRRLVLEPSDVKGTVHLYGATITDLKTGAKPPGPLVATGWEVSDIDGPLRSDWAAARRWLETTAETSTQPWHALAAVYERNGEPAAAKRLRFTAANKVTSQSPLPTKVLRSIYGAVVGHGYCPLLAGFWLVVVIFAGSIIVAANRAEFVPTRDAETAAAMAYLQQTHNATPTQTPLKPIHYTLSALLPTAVGTAGSDWTVSADAPWLSLTLTALKLTAWVLTALLLAGVAGLLRKA